MSFDQIRNVRTERNSFQLAPRGIDTDEALDIAVLTAWEKVKTDDGSNLVVDLIELYLQSTPPRILAIRNAVAEQEWVALKHAAHTLKGSSSTLGLRQVANVCQGLEEASSLSFRDGAEQLVQLLESKYFKAQQALEAERDRRLHGITRTLRNV